MPVLAASWLAIASAQTPGSIAAGDGHTLVARADGTVWSFGRNFIGQLGDGTTIGRLTPVQVKDLPAIREVATRGLTSYALDRDGGVWAWGSNAEGQVGDGTTTARGRPVRVSGLANIVAISAGNGHAVALRNDGTVWAWGSNLRGQLGDGTLAARATPVRVNGLPPIAQVRAGNSHGTAIALDGSVWSWGGNFNGQLGINSLTPSAVPVRVSLITVPAQLITAGDSHAMVVLADGSARGLGSNFQGQSLTFAVGSGSLAPGIVSGLPRVQALVAGDNYTLAIGADRSLLGWGSNGEGTLGIGSTSPPAAYTVQRSSRIANVVAVAAGPYHAVAITADGTVHAWGNNDHGMLGDGTLVSRPTPGPVLGIDGSGVFSVNAATTSANASPTPRIAASSTRGNLPLTVTLSGSGATDPDGMISRYTWYTSDGRGAEGASAAFVFGQSGRFRIALRVIDNAGASSFADVEVFVEDPANLAATGVAHSVRGSRGAMTLALRADGTLRAWGLNSVFGNGFVNRAVVPYAVAVENFPGVIRIASRTAQSYAVRTDGTLWAWGVNTNGQLGDGTMVFRNRPVRVAGLDNVRAVASGSAYAIALRGDGTVWSWGSNVNGRLGDGTTIDRLLPAQIPGLRDIAAISAGEVHAVALRSDGVVFSWGAAGMHGDGSNQVRSTPVVVPTIGGVVSVDAGYNRTLAVRSDGTVWIWGGVVPGVAIFNQNYPEAATPFPVQVAGLDNIVEVATNWGTYAALRRDGTLWAWGSNLSGQLGDGTRIGRGQPRPIPGLRDIVSFDAGEWLVASNADGLVFSAGSNFLGELGDGTLAARATPRLVIGEGATGFVDLVPASVNRIPPEQIQAFPLIATGNSSETGFGLVTATVGIRPELVGTTGAVYVFALAPADIVRPAPGGESSFEVGKAKSAGKETAVSCVLAQLNASGQLQAVSASSLQAFVTGVLSAQGQSVTVINGVPTVNIGGATFYVGYGPNATAMLNGGLNRSVVSAPGAKECKPEAPQTGWWWNVNEGGRGYSLEVQGSLLFYAAFLYDESGRSKWYVATGRTSLDGSLFTGDLLDVRNGQTLFGAYRAPNPITSAGPITLAFDTATTGTMVWPGGVVAIERFNIVPGGLAALPQENQPESGWWWNPAESGRGFFIEWQNGSADLAGYMYDDAGNPVWYLSVQPTPDPRAFTGMWWTYANGQTLTGAYRPATQTSNTFAPLSILFTSRDTATITLPGGRSSNLVRHRF